MGYRLPGALEALHGVEPHEVLQALGSPSRWPRPGTDPVTGLRLLTVWARTTAGRPLIVAIRRHGAWDWWIVTARPMRPEELEQQEQWEAGT